MKTLFTPPGSAALCAGCLCSGLCLFVMCTCVWQETPRFGNISIKVKSVCTSAWDKRIIRLSPRPLRNERKSEANTWPALHSTTTTAAAAAKTSGLYKQKISVFIKAAGENDFMDQRSQEEQVVVVGFFFFFLCSSIFSWQPNNPNINQSPSRGDPTQPSVIQPLSQSQAADGQMNITAPRLFIASSFSLSNCTVVIDRWMRALIWSTKRKQKDPRRRTFKARRRQETNGDVERFCWFPSETDWRVRERQKKTHTALWSGSQQRRRC